MTRPAPNLSWEEGKGSNVSDGRSSAHDRQWSEELRRDAGFEHVSRYVSGLVLSEHKTLQAIHAQQVWPEGKEVSRRAMHAAVFEAGWSSEELMVKHRAEVAKDHQGGRGREVIGMDWTLAHHERGPQIYGVKEAYDSARRAPSGSRFDRSSDRARTPRSRSTVNRPASAGNIRPALWRPPTR